MKIQIDDKGRKDKELELTNLVVVLNKDVELRLSQDNQGNLEITKMQYGNGESAIVIKPSVSNQIRIS